MTPFSLGLLLGIFAGFSPVAVLSVRRGLDVLDN